MTGALCADSFRHCTKLEHGVRSFLAAAKVKCDITHAHLFGAASTLYISTGPVTEKNGYAH